jgi:hypothetical protein
MSDQLQMFKAEAGDANVRFFIEHLKGQRRWFPAKELETQTGWTDRDIRSYAEASEGRVISGQNGYKHADNSTADEIAHFANQMESRGRKMIARANAVRIYAHQLVG